MKIHIIVGSVRAQRLCPQIAAWVAEVGRGEMAHDIEVVDLKAWPLPMDDEPEIPARGVYANPHTQAWSRKVREADAVVFVSPQYNWGYPAPLKNAIDHLHGEWAGKPAMIVSYGSRGGGLCAGQLRQVLQGLDMKTVETMPGLKLGRTRIEANAGDIDPAEAFAEQLDELRQGFAELDAGLAALSQALQDRTA